MIRLRTRAGECHAGAKLIASLMGAPFPATQLFRFGLFEFDPQSKELRKQGMKIKFQGQPVEILALLLARAGEVVTREEFQKKLWQAETFVDFERSLNAAMKRLRAALGESADNPVYIETLARRGYRFVAPVQSVQTVMPLSLIHI